jgi:hypothetical protein
VVKGVGQRSLIEKLEREVEKAAERLSELPFWVRGSSNLIDGKQSGNALVRGGDRSVGF